MLMGLFIAIINPIIPISVCFTSGICYANGDSLTKRIKDFETRDWSLCLIADGVSLISFMTYKVYNICENS